MSNTSERSAAAAAVIRAFDPLWFEILSHPVRIEIIRWLLEHGGGPIKEIAAAFPQDRSVISRHLAQMERAGIVTAERRGRKVLYDLNGPELVCRLGRLTEAAAALSRICCPAEGGCGADQGADRDKERKQR